jgi:SAM-dependent MidA family methyltransferase
MTPAGEMLRDEIRRGGAIPFRRFMEVALYHPEHGYYARPSADPFGKEGDFFTAEQLQPVFGILVRQYARQLLGERNGTANVVVELGAGRGEMADAFSPWRYIPIDIRRGALPQRFSGLVFANEFFDALPVDVVARRGERWREMRVTWDGARFQWSEGEHAPDEIADYSVRYMPEMQDGAMAEVNLAALEWLERVAGHLESGFLLTLDYGYHFRELIRFPRGTLMSYRRHRALDDVLDEPGSRDITAHVNFTALERRAREVGFAVRASERMGLTLLRAGEPDEFAEALGSGGDQERSRRSLQLKTLLFGMGETFHTLLLERREGGQK